MMHRIIKKVTQDIENLKFNTAIAALMELVNVLYGVNLEFGALDLKFSKTLVLLLAPFAPFMTEELWTKVLKQPYSVHQQPWPKYDPVLAREEKNIIVVQVNGKRRGEISVGATAPTQEHIVSLAKADPQIAKYLSGKIKRVIYIPGKLVNFVI